MVKVEEVKKTEKNENRGKFINFAEMGEYAIYIIGLGRWKPLSLCHMKSTFFLRACVKKVIFNTFNDKLHCFPADFSTLSSSCILPVTSKQEEYKQSC